MKTKDAVAIGAVIHQAVNSERDVTVEESYEWAESVVEDLVSLGAFGSAQERAESVIQADKETNPKGWLQELCQKAGRPLPLYETKNRGLGGFFTRVQVDWFSTVVEATGIPQRSKKEAEQEAARIMIEVKLPEEDPEYLDMINGGKS